MNKVGAVLSGRIRNELSELARVADRVEQGWERATGAFPAIPHQLIETALFQVFQNRVCKGSDRPAAGFGIPWLPPRSCHN